MAKQSSNNEKRLQIPYFEGINSAVQSSLGKITELSHAENARGPLIGVIEKRQGQTKVGKASNGAVFYTRANYGISSLGLTDDSYQGVFRISATQTFSNTLEMSVFEDITVIDNQMVFGTAPLFLKIHEYIAVSEPEFFSRQFDGVGIIDGTTIGASIYSLTAADIWSQLSDTDAQNIMGANFDFSAVDDSLVMVNGKDHNRMLSSDGVTVIDATDAGSLFNSPRAKKVSYYKNRIYLANFIRDNIKNGNTILRSSYPVGLLTLVNGDVSDSTTIGITDSKYFYTDSGMNEYEVWRGSTQIGSTLTVTTVNETSIIVNASVTLLSADEIWIAGTRTGAKQYRWVNDPASTGKDVKQYDTFKLSGGGEGETTLLETIGNVLLIGNKNTLMTWNDYTLQNFDLGVGPVSQNGYVKLLGTLYFIHYSGIYSTTGEAPTLISRKIARYIDGASKASLESTATGFKGTSIFFSIGDSNLYNPDGSFWKTLKDTCIEYNVLDQRWYIHTNVPVEMFLNFVSSSGTEQCLIEHSGDGKSIKEFLTGYTDDGDEIFFRVDTNDIQFMEEFEYSIQPKSIVTDLTRGAEVTTMVSLNGEEFYSIEGTNKKGITPLKVTSRDRQQVEPAICKRMKISFRESSRQRCRMTKVAIIYTPTSLTNPEE